MNLFLSYYNVHPVKRHFRNSSSEKIHFLWIGLLFFSHRVNCTKTYEVRLGLGATNLGSYRVMRVLDYKVMGLWSYEVVTFWSDTLTRY